MYSKWTWFLRSRSGLCCLLHCQWARWFHCKQCRLIEICSLVRSYAYKIILRWTKEKTAHRAQSPSIPIQEFYKNAYGVLFLHRNNMIFTIKKNTSKQPASAKSTASARKTYHKMRIYWLHWFIDKNRSFWPKRKKLLSWLTNIPLSANVVLVLLLFQLLLPTVFCIYLSVFATIGTI